MQHTMDNLLLRLNYDIVKGGMGGLRGGGGGGGVILEQKPHLSIIHSETDLKKFFTEVTSFNGDLHLRIFGCG